MPLPVRKIQSQQIALAIFSLKAHLLLLKYYYRKLTPLNEKHIKNLSPRLAFF